MRILNQYGLGDEVCGQILDAIIFLAEPHLFTIRRAHWLNELISDWESPDFEQLFDRLDAIIETAELDIDIIKLRIAESYANIHDSDAFVDFVSGVKVDDMMRYKPKTMPPMADGGDYHNVHLCALASLLTGLPLTIESARNEKAA